MKEHKVWGGVKKLISSSILTLANWPKLFLLLLQNSLVTIMVGSCVAYCCTNRQKRVETFLPIPFLTKILNFCSYGCKQAIQRQDWSPKHHSLICSTHFKDSCFVVRPGKKVEDWKKMQSQLSFLLFLLTCKERHKKNESHQRKDC